MSHRKIDPDEPTENSNVVVLQPAGGRTGKRSCAKGTQGTPALVQISSGSDSMTHDGLSLLRAFFAIEDVAARTSLITLAQKLAAHSPKR
jgi:hypothetical protein